MMDTIDETRGHRPRPRHVIGAFLYVWLMVGFISGTLVLLGPVGWMTSGIQRLGWGQTAEDWILRLVILLYVIASVFIARWLVSVMFRAKTPAVRYGIPALATVAAGLALWGWMNPGRMLANTAGGEAVTGEVAIASGAEFVFGPYPDRAKLEELKREGVTAVVSLQHPSVPIEVPGIAEERRATDELGMRFIHAPMLPWVSDNRESLNMIRELARTGEGRYYVHCGLGRDRVNVAKRVIERVGASVAEAEGLKEATTFADRVEPFERGKVFRLAEGLWLIPHPNKHEFFGYMIGGQVGHVVSLLDPSNPEHSAWIEEQRELFEEYEIDFTSLPVRAGDRAAALEAVRRLPSLTGPVAVVVPRTSYTELDHVEGAAAEFLGAWQEARTVPQPRGRAGARAS